MSCSKRKKPFRSTRREAALRDQLQASYQEQEVLVQHQQVLLAERDQFYWRLMQVMGTDAVTGLPNHQAVINRLEEEILRCQQTARSCALLFVDLDHFKWVNDSWGHRAGDLLLHELAQRMRTTLRPEDFLGRYGGEEFLILLPEGDVPAATLTAECLRSVISSHSCSWQPNLGSEAVTIATTASIGVAVYPLHGTSVETLLEAADRAMYRAKYRGRNRISLADVEMAAAPSLHDDKEYLAVQALTAVASLHDDDTNAHGQRLVHLMEATARQLKRPPEEIHLLRLAALLHDIGKMGIPEAILHKPGPLTQQEWTVMRQHPELGRQMLEQVGGVFAELAPLVGMHHERWDGRGYPNGLAHEAIPVSVRILAVVDAYDAMISARPYRREPLRVGEAKTELQRCAGSQFDPDVVKAFVDLLQEQQQQPGPLEEAKVASTSDRPNLPIRLPTYKAGQSVAQWREQMVEWQEQVAQWRAQMAQWREQQGALQQRIEAWQQYQHYLAWRKQERERQPQGLSPLNNGKQGGPS